MAHLVSVVIPVLNESLTLPSLIKSLAQGSRRPEEIIMVDGGSTDGSQSVVTALAGDVPGLRLVEERQAYPGRARNVGVQASAGGIIAFIDAGMKPSETWLQDLVVPFETDPGLEVVWGGCSLEPLNDWERTIALLHHNPQGSRFVANSAMRRGSFDRVGGFREDLRAAEDLDFIRRCDEAGLSQLYSTAKVAYSGYPPSYGELYHKWQTYAACDVRAGTWRRKAVVASIEGFLLATSLAFGLIAGPLFGGLLMVWSVILMFLVGVQRSGGWKRFKPVDIWRGPLILLTMDLGRGTGLAKGLIQSVSRQRQP